MPVCACNICGWSKELPASVLDWPSALTGPADLYPVTISGKLDQQVRGYICAKCLRAASEARLNLKALVSDMRVSVHAVDRFMERQEGEYITRDAARLAIIRMFQRARPIEFRERFMAQRLANNGNQPAEYRYVGGWILVASLDKPQTVMTVERNWQRRLGHDFWYTDES